MKITKEMEVNICDICKKEVAHYSCANCKNDICNKHALNVYTSGAENRSYYTGDVGFFVQGQGQPLQWIKIICSECAKKL